MRSPFENRTHFISDHIVAQILTRKGNRIEFDEPDHVSKSPELSTWIEYGTSKASILTGRKMYFYVNDECGKNTNADVSETLEIIRPF